LEPLHIVVSAQISSQGLLARNQARPLLVEYRQFLSGLGGERLQSLKSLLFVG
jgi:hypothetical protein